MSNNTFCESLLPFPLVSKWLCRRNGCHHGEGSFAIGGLARSIHCPKRLEAGLDPSDS